MGPSSTPILTLEAALGRKPKWSMVLMVVAVYLAGAFADIAWHFLNPAVDWESCKELCGGFVEEVTRDSCRCEPGDCE